MYLIRLDDASDYMDMEKWDRIEKILDKHSIKPIVGIIPNNKDEELINKYKYNQNFWIKAKKWQDKNWTIALHGYTHVYSTNDGGINPVNSQSEFAGVSLKEQREKICKGIKVFKNHGIDSKVFFAPSHTFDHNTLKALKKESSIRIISDTIANDIYKEDDFYFIPQQSGKVRKLPFKVTTFCYHPNIMNEDDFIILDEFLAEQKNEFVKLDDLNFTNRHASLYDKILKKLYFFIRRVRHMVKGR